mgnify:CR=1 FL=1
MMKCYNCGHDSHCGIPLRKAVDRSQAHAAGLYEIEVCKQCRCEKCDPTLSGNYK